MPDVQRRGPHLDIPGADINLARSPAAVVAIVLLLGASYYLWRKRYIRGPAALITILSIIVILSYFAFFKDRPPT